MHQKSKLKTGDGSSRHRGYLKVAWKLPRYLDKSNAAAFSYKGVNPPPAFVGCSANGLVAPVSGDSVTQSDTLKVVSSHPAETDRERSRHRTLQIWTHLGGGKRRDPGRTRASKGTTAIESLKD